MHMKFSTTADIIIGLSDLSELLSDLYNMHVK